MEDSKRQHVEGLERLKEAREFAEWSRKDKEARLPELTDEQREQMRQYLQLVGKHGVTQAASNEDCVGCPVVRNATEILGLRTQTE